MCVLWRDGVREIRVESSVRFAFWLSPIQLEVRVLRRAYLRIINGDYSDSRWQKIEFEAAIVYRTFGTIKEI